MSCCLACAAACATPSWAPRLRKHALKTEVLALPEEFVDYLLEDGVVLPDLPADLPMHAMDPRLRNHRCDSDDEFDDAGIPGVDAGTPGEDAGSGGDSVDSPPPRRCFQALEVAIADAIERLGGAVFIALDWSSPQDASWISEAKSIKCTCAGEVFLLLKSSDHIQRDLELGQLLADAGSCGQCHRAAVPYDAAGPTPAHRHRYPHHLVLKPWYSLPPAGIFRCFVSGGNLLAVSQKHTDQHFRDLAARIDTVLASLSAFLEHLRPRKAHAGTEAEAHGALPLSTVVVDVFVGAHQNRDGSGAPPSIRLLGLSPCLRGGGEHGVDPGLFTWDELAALAGGRLACEHGVGGSGAEASAAGARDLLPPDPGPLPPSPAAAPPRPLVRIVESEALCFSRHAVYGFPDDLLEAAARGLVPRGGELDGAIDLAAAAIALDKSATD